MKISDKRKAGELLGREGISERIIELLRNFEGGYKEAVMLAGRMAVLHEAASFDDYWGEKTTIGRQNEEFNLERILATTDKGSE